MSTGWKAIDQTWAGVRVVRSLQMGGMPRPYSVDMLASGLARLHGEFPRHPLFRTAEGNVRRNFSPQPLPVGALAVVESRTTSLSSRSANAFDWFASEDTIAVDYSHALGDAHTGGYLLRLCARLALGLPIELLPKRSMAVGQMFRTTSSVIRQPRSSLADARRYLALRSERPKFEIAQSGETGSDASLVAHFLLPNEPRRPGLSLTADVAAKVCQQFIAEGRDFSPDNFVVLFSVSSRGRRGMPFQNNAVPVYLSLNDPLDADQWDSAIKAAAVSTLPALLHSSMTLRALRRRAGGADIGHVENSAAQRAGSTFSISLVRQPLVAAELGGGEVINYFIMTDSVAASTTGCWVDRVDNRLWVSVSRPSPALGEGSSL